MSPAIEGSSSDCLALSNPWLADRYNGPKCPKPVAVMPTMPGRIRFPAIILHRSDQKKPDRLVKTIGLKGAP